MKCRIGLYSVVFLMLLASCGGRTSSGETTANSSGTNFNYPNAKPVSTADTTAPVTIPPVSVSPGNEVVQPVTGAGLNPEHGKPGHRCDIAVGAPLNSKPAATTVNATPTVQPQQPVTIQQSPVTINTNPAPTGKGLNPEHGKPGHRCDIAVGAPLDSKPVVVDASSQVTPVNTTPASPIPQPTPVQVQPAPVQPANTNPVTIATGAGLNPEHGKPGHRCDIAVGAPLDSKPKQ